MGEVPFVRVLPGVVVSTGTALAVNVQGSTLTGVKWPAGYIPTSGDAVDLLMVDGYARVLGPVITSQRPGRGTVADAPSGGLVLLDTAFGPVSAKFVGTAPAIGTSVFLDWQETTPRLLSAEAANTVAAPSGPVTGPTTPPPPPSTSAGSDVFTATASGTYSVTDGAWSSFHGTDLTQGAWSGRTTTGSWFYGDAPRRLDSRTITSAGLRLGARRRIGNYNSSLVLNLWLHSSTARPGGDVTRTAGPFAVTLDPNAGAQWVAVPTEWGQSIVDSGGGIGIATGSYGGVDGVGDDPASGQLSLNWTA